MPPMDKLPVKIYNFFGRPPISYKNITINAVIAYGIIILTIYAYEHAYEPPTMTVSAVSALIAVILGIKLFLSESGVVLANLWTRAGGKLIYGIIALIVVQFSQMLGTLIIQTVIQTNPEQLANGQRFLTTSFIIFGVVAIIYILMVIFLIVGFFAAIFNLIYRVAVDQNIKRFYAFAQLFSIAALALLIVQVSNKSINPAAAWIEDGFIMSMTRAGKHSRRIKWFASGCA